MTYPRLPKLAGGLVGSPRRNQRPLAGLGLFDSGRSDERRVLILPLSRIGRFRFCRLVTLVGDAGDEQCLPSPELVQDMPEIIELRLSPEHDIVLFEQLSQLSPLFSGCFTHEIPPYDSWYSLAPHVLTSTRFLG